MRLSQLLSEFLSTPSGWRATVVLVALFPRCFNFYPRPPGGGRPFCISKDICVYNFYPRPPGGGRLSHSMFPRTAETISIHALRVEGDFIYIRYGCIVKYFYPRPPGGGRRVVKVDPTASDTAFLSTPSGWRATLGGLLPCQRQLRFLSTPSGWRATCIPVSFRFRQP